MLLYRIDFSKDMLRKMTKEERGFFLLIGHVQNELNSLNKIFTWCLSSSEGKASEIESLADGLQSHMAFRLLAGKLYEAWEAVRKYYFNKLSRELDEKIPSESYLALQALKKYFGKPNIINKVRNNFVFHYGAEGFEEYWEESINEDELSIILGGAVGNNLYLAGELVANRSVFNIADGSNLENGLQIYLEEVQKIAVSFNNFFEGVMLTLLKPHFGGDLATISKKVEIFPALNYEHVKIPYFVNPAVFDGSA